MQKRDSFKCTLRLLRVLAAFFGEAEIQGFQPLLFYSASATSKAQQKMCVSSWYWNRPFEMQSSIGKSSPTTDVL